MILKIIKKQVPIIDNNYIIIPIIDSTYPLFY